MAKGPIEQANEFVFHGIDDLSTNQSGGGLAPVSDKQFRPQRGKALLSNTGFPTTVCSSYRDVFTP